MWEPALAEHGAVIWIGARARGSESIERTLRACCAPRSARRAQVRVRYVELAGAVERRSGRARSRARSRRSAALDLRRGLTHAGPHRDDLDHSRSTDASCATFGSAGQQRSAAIALRMLEAATFTRAHRPRAALSARRSVRRARRAPLGAHSRSARRAAAARRRQIMLAVPRESDIPPALTGLERLSRGGRPGLADGRRP